MNVTDNLKLLRDYADNGDETAFRELVKRYVDLVYSAALRRVGGDAGLAQDVTQTVFTDLARKAKSLRNVELLGGWLHRHTGFVASNMVRSEQRRQIREQEAAQMNATHDSPDSIWQQLAPMLDDTIESLESEDRQAVLLRFFERHDFRHIGNALGVSDDAAQKRVSRAVEKLRGLLTARGVTLSVVLLSSILAGRVIGAAPAGLAGSVAGIALSGAAGGGLGLMLFNLTKSLSFKIAVVGTVAAVGVWLFLPRHSNSTSEPRGQLNSVTALVETTNVPLATGESPITASASQASSTNAVGKVLSLTIIAADSGQPVPNAELDYWLFEEGNIKHRKPLVADRFGACKVPVPDDTTHLILVSERDGFAETLLEWRPDHGEQIPAQYTLQLARAVPIGGQVVDPDGNPVAGATIGIGNRTEAGSETRPQSDDFGWPYYVTTKTDTQGHWQINRIGKGALRTITGAARHPDFVRSDIVPYNRSPEINTQLLAGTYITTLGRAVTVRGVVKGPDGQPVPNARVLVGIDGEENSREGKSENDGTFSIKGCQPSKGLITGDAKGFAATTMHVELTNNCGPFELILRQGKVVKLRVVDEDGNPVPKAQVYFNHFPEGFGGKETTPTQVEFSQQTDANGRLEWDSAPPDEKLGFDISANSFLGKNSVDVPADGIEHIITLQSGLTIAGTVVDAGTGRPIPCFRIITGWPNVGSFENTTNFTWSTIDRFWLNFSGGKFQYTYDEEVIGRVKDPTYVFKIEAEGYAPFITRCVRATERSVRFDVALARAATTKITVLSPDGRPEANVDIGLVSPGARLHLVPGGLSHENIQSGGTILLTDKQGEFGLPPDSTITTVIAAVPQGYAEATPAQLQADPVMNLLPWGRLEGTYLVNGQPATSKTLSIWYSSEVGFDSISCDGMAFKTKTDSEGRFAFAKVPAGNHEVTLIVGDMNSGWSESPLQKVTVVAGETTTITIGSSNQTDQANSNSTN